MCGLLAASGKFKPEIVAALGCLNSSRGRDSAGIAWIEKGKVRLKKRAADPLVVFNVDLRQEIENALPGGLVIGHTRAATHGNKTSENAHPFMDEGIAFAHNGVISNYQDFGQYEVDSQCLIHGIISKDFSPFQGNIALLWIENGKIHAFRKGNPLFRGILNGALYLSSEDDDLKAVGCQKVRELSEGHIYIIEKGGISSSKKVPVNAGWTTHSPAYSRPHFGERWFNGHWKKVEESPKPDADAECQCAHKGIDHSHFSASSQGWSCYARVNDTPMSPCCPCNEFRLAKKEEKQLEIVKSKRIHTICACRHGIIRHSMRGVNQSCDVYRCPCTNFIESKVNDDDMSIPPQELWNQGIDNLPPETLCECVHELEYHHGGLHCSVSMCECKWFWPLEKEDEIEANFR